jgi:putative addiction module component (TIGR02574 family)
VSDIIIDLTFNFIAIKEEEGYDLSAAQQEELDSRLERYERGDMKFKSWEETKASIRSRSKNAL